MNAIFPLLTAEEIRHKAIDITSSPAFLSNTKLTKLIFYNWPLIRVGDALTQGQVKTPFIECFLVVQTNSSKNNQVLLNLDYLLADNLAPTIMANKLLQTNYLTLINAFRKEGLLDDVTVEKLWSEVAGGQNPGWWQIQSDFFLLLCLVAQRSANGSFKYMINCGMFCFLLYTHVANN